MVAFQRADRLLGRYFNKDGGLCNNIFGQLSDLFGPTYLLKNRFNKEGSRKNSVIAISREFVARAITLPSR